jgi:2-keto-4-pentenoate hydratase/2-oxohepta-3-ene-1,7-dioic acid hydratase in catechol pathway
VRIANVSGRLTLLTDAGGIDVERGSEGGFTADPAAIYERWAEFRTWADGQPTDTGTPVADEQLGAPSPAPRQVFAIGLNYADHSAESGFAVPDTTPPTFTKFPTCITGPYTDLVLPEGDVDWEVELVAVIGVRAERVPAAKAWDHIAGLTVGQDFSERVIQLAGPAPQFSLGKSYPGFGPTGPWLVTPDEFDNRDDLTLTCSVNDEVVQHGRTTQMIFPMSELIERLSAVCPLLPGDLIFTGTPAGVGMGREPQRFLNVGDVVVTEISGIGTLRTRCVAGSR